MSKHEIENRVAMATNDTLDANIFSESACSQISGLTQCSVPTASYGSSFFPSFYGPSAKRTGHENKEGKYEDP